MAKNIKAILFDIDDTLFDRNLAQAKILQIIVDILPGIFGALDIKRVAKAFSESDRLTVAEFDSGLPSDGLRDKRSRIFLSLLALPESFADKITEIYVGQLPAVNTPVEGAVRLVRELSGKYQLGAVSNGLPDVQYRKLESMGIRHLFSCIVLSEEVGIRNRTLAFSLKRRTYYMCYQGSVYISEILTRAILSVLRMQGCKLAGLTAPNYCLKTSKSNLISWSETYWKSQNYLNR
jgi:FMN phosphatase YigB (HAD superfamily)